MLTVTFYGQVIFSQGWPLQHSPLTTRVPKHASITVDATKSSAVENLDNPHVRIWNLYPLHNELWLNRPLVLDLYSKGGKQRSRHGYECFIFLNQVQTEYPVGLRGLLQITVLVKTNTTASAIQTPHSRATAEKGRMRTEDKYYHFY